ncbi:cysteine desulfurase family protein [Desulfatitalea alkaliphila]|uniref:cysteine desulfurase n=1 Tax=Desulfatitalea alkaliphila TaxID=2929485 RepID=A0AA41UKG0_9BACT|nr:aminotransferase class V-fold PLP-dependent enzyme [Desulfatitalea alkaliphila]MCJ8502274.1 aminotransferase class V-fold PLP-dependent enzyme [Desulfatitalea alkaliphila]
MVQPIYLDYNGTTPHDPEVAAAMRPFLETEFGNPSSSHWYGIRPKQAVEAARRQTAALLNCRPEEIVFTSGGTESNNHALKGMARTLKAKGRHIITTAFEHPAVLEVCRHLVDHEGFEATVVAVDGLGMVDPDAVARAIRTDTILISVMHANNEVGTVQPIAEIATIARRHGVVMHTDAAQSAGKIAVDVHALGVDLLSLAGHKLYAPKGVGALFIRTGLLPQVYCHGAGQERGWRAGTENVLEIVGLGKACEVAARDLTANMAQMQAMRDRLHQGLAEQVAAMRLNGHPEHRLPNTVSLAFHNKEANRLLEEIGLAVAASAGAACHADSVSLSHVLEAMQVPLEWAKGTLRFSVGRRTTIEEIDRAVAVVAAAAAQ